MSDEQITAVNEALGKLQALGSSRQIADYLSEQGHVGRTGDGDSCPVHMYVKAATGVHAWINSSWWEMPASSETYTLGENVENFVRDFDEDAYPDLDADALAADERDAEPIEQILTTLKERMGSAPGAGKPESLPEVSS